MATARRRADILIRCATPTGATKADLLAHLDPPISARTLGHDLAWLQRHHPTGFITLRRGRAHAWRYDGPLPTVLAQPIAALDADQVAALIAARGLLHLPATDAPTAERPAQAYRGCLATAIDRLLAEAGLHAEAGRLAPDDLCISRFGIAEEPAELFPLLLATLQAGEGLRAAYRNREGRVSQIHVRPIRLVSIGGEWFLFAWSADTARPPGRIKQYRLSRMDAAERTPDLPPGCPHSGLRRQVAAALSEAFGATGSDDPAHRIRITVGLDTMGHSFMAGRRWGADQHLLPGPHPGLPPDWWRLDFVTTGLAEAKHKLLSLGRHARVLAPAHLVTEIRDEAQAIFEAANLAIDIANHGR